LAFLVLKFKEGDLGLGSGLGIYFWKAPFPKRLLIWGFPFKLASLGEQGGIKKERLARLPRRNPFQKGEFLFQVPKGNHPVVVIPFFKLGIVPPPILPSLGSPKFRIPILTKVSLRKSSHFLGGKTRVPQFLKIPPSLGWAG